MLHCYRPVKQFEETGSVGCKYSSYIPAEEVVGAAQEAIMRGPR
jgi:hypothetical protein